jgi:hypothetical protein
LPFSVVIGLVDIGDVQIPGGHKFAHQRRLHSDVEFRVIKIYSFSGLKRNRWALARAADPSAFQFRCASVLIGEHTIVSARLRIGNQACSLWTPRISSLCCVFADFRKPLMKLQFPLRLG